MSKKEIPTPPKHKFSTEIQAAIGRFILTWDSLENEINSAIEELYRLESDLAGCITANLGTRPKLDIFLFPVRPSHG